MLVQLALASIFRTLRGMQLRIVDEETSLSGTMFSFPTVQYKVPNSKIKISKGTNFSYSPSESNVLSQGRRRRTIVWMMLWKKEPAILLLLEQRILPLAHLILHTR
jgi:hypothetical protein